MIQLFAAIRQKGIKPGTLVVSVAGHDKLRVYLVVRVDTKFAWLTDGRLRPLEKQKKKNITHLRPLGQINDSQRLEKAFSLSEPGQRNAALRKMIDEFINQNLLKEEI